MARRPTSLACEWSAAAVVAAASLTLGYPLDPVSPWTVLNSSRQTSTQRETTRQGVSPWLDRLAEAIGATDASKSMGEWAIVFRGDGPHTQRTAARVGLRPHAERPPSLDRPAPRLIDLPPPLPRA